MNVYLLFFCLLRPVIQEENVSEKQTCVNILREIKQLASSFNL